MSDLTFDIEWIAPEAVRVPEFEATWAELRIEAGGRALTRFQDERTRSLRRSLVLPLYPLAEWIASNWWSLRYESVTPGRSDAVQQGYAHRHDLRYARDGYALPDVRFAPAGEAVRVSWTPARLDHYQIEFLDGGQEWVDATAFGEALTQLLDAVDARLEQHDLTGTHFQEEWAAVRSADAEEAAFCRAAARLGASPYALTDEEEAQLLDVADRVPAALHDAFFGAARPDALHDQARRLHDALEQIRGRDTRADRLRDLRRDYAGVNHQRLPWSEGYDQARRLRRTLDRERDRFDTTDDVAEALYLDGADESIVGAPGTGPLFDALVATNEHEAPGFAIERTHDTGRKFAFCRGMFEYLNAANGHPHLVTREQTERQKRNRAFAAEFLAPSYLLSEEVSGRIVSQEEVEDLAVHFGVSSLVVEHQLENHGLVDEVVS